MGTHYHFIGIGGIGMSGLAHFLLSQNITVSGSDIAFNAIIENLIQAGAIVYKGQAAENIPVNAKVVYTSDVKADNPEYQAAIKMNSVLLHRSDLLAELLEGKRSLAVAGTHGKTTTSSLLATVLMEANWDPSFAIGGMLSAFHCNARFGKGEFFAFEADESDGSFLKYHPFGAIVTNIDNDHLNNYEGRFDLLLSSFKQFLTQVQSPQHLFWCLDDPYLLELNAPGQHYGFHPASDWEITSIRQEGFKTYFDLDHHGNLYEQIELALIGRHNVLNAAAVFGLAYTLGVSETIIRQAFKAFKGVLRRCENKGSYHKVLFLDDYAHHPTEIQTTLQGIREAIGPKRLLAVFQPHRYSRTQDCLGQYGSIFEVADELILTDIYAAGETPLPHISHTIIQEEIQENSTVPCCYVPRPALSHYLSQKIQPYDVIVTLGAGDITKLSNETLSLIENQPLPHLKVGWIWDSGSIKHFKSQLQFFSSPYLTFFDFGITPDHHWVIGKKGLEQFLIEKSSQEQKNACLSLSFIEELLKCDVVISLLFDHSEIPIESFLEVLGKPYIECNQMNHLLEKNSDGVFHSHLEEDKGIISSLLVALQKKRWKERQQLLRKKLNVYDDQ